MVKIDNFFHAALLTLVYLLVYFLGIIPIGDYAIFTYITSFVDFCIKSSLIQVKLSFGAYVEVYNNRVSLPSPLFILFLEKFTFYY